MTVAAGLQPGDMFDLRFVRDAKLSPDGSQVVCAVSSTDSASLTEACVLWVIDLASGEQRVLTSDDGFASYPRWSPDGTMIAYVEKAGGSLTLMVLWTTSGRARALTSSDRTVVGAPTWSPDSRHLAVVAGAAPAADPPMIRVTRRVFRADGIGQLAAPRLGIDIVRVADGHTEILHEETEAVHCAEPRWSPTGDQLLFLAHSEPDADPTYLARLRAIDLTSRVARDVLGDWGGCQAAEWLPDGERIALIGAAAGHHAWRNLDLWVVGAVGAPDCRTPDTTAHVGCRAVQDMPIGNLIKVGGLVVDSSERAIVTLQTGGEAGVWEVALDGPTGLRQLVGGERTCLVVDSQPAVGQLFIATDMHRPTELYLVSDGERQLTELNEKVLAGWPVMRAEHLTFTAPDGLGLEGWFLAREDAATSLPTVLNIHQGPYTSVGHAFRFDLHLLASNGIGVMFSNFRGSPGYGQDFIDAMGFDWGAAGFPDHMAAIDAAEAHGLSDPDRLGVWGASHGGFATCWVVGHTDRFVAAVAEAAISDFTSTYYVSDIPDFWELKLGGRPDEVPEVYRERSPVTYASNCKTPILMLHCEGDLRCPIGQAETFHRAVLDAGGVSELAIIRHGSHSADSMGAPYVRLAQNEALLDWFTRYLTREPS